MNMAQINNDNNVFTLSSHIKTESYTMVAFCSGNRKVYCFAFFSVLTCLQGTLARLSLTHCRRGIDHVVFEVEVSEDYVYIYRYII